MKPEQEDYYPYTGFTVGEDLRVYPVWVTDDDSAEPCTYFHDACAAVLAVPQEDGPPVLGVGGSYWRAVLRELASDEYDPCGCGCGVVDTEPTCNCAECILVDAGRAIAKYEAETGHRVDREELGPLVPVPGDPEGDR